MQAAAVDALEIEEKGQFVRGVQRAQDGDFTVREGGQGRVRPAGYEDGLRAGIRLQPGEERGRRQAGEEP